MQKMFEKDRIQNLPKRYLQGYLLVIQVLTLQNVVIIEDYQVNQPIQQDFNTSGNLVVANPVQDISENTATKPQEVNESQLDKSQRKTLNLPSEEQLYSNLMKKNQRNLQFPIMLQPRYQKMISISVIKRMGISYCYVNKV